MIDIEEASITYLQSCMNRGEITSKELVLAYMNGIVGLKPTVGLISRSGIIPISNSQDTAGPMTRTVEDAAIMLGALAGIDQIDPATWASKGRSYEDYTPFLDENGLQGMRIGINNGYIGDFSEDEQKVIDSVGGKSSVLLYGFKQCLNAYTCRI